MKKVFYWCRWLSVIPAYFIGGFVGYLPAMLIARYLVDPDSHYFWLESVLAFICSAFGTTFFCAWAAPKAKRLVGILAAVFVVIGALVVGPGINKETTQGPVNPLLIGYTLGPFLAAILLFWLFSRNSSLSSPEKH